MAVEGGGMVQWLEGQGVRWWFCRKPGSMQDVQRKASCRHRSLRREHIQGIFLDMSVLAWNLSICEVEAGG